MHFLKISVIVLAMCLAVLEAKQNEHKGEHKSKDVVAPKPVTKQGLLRSLIAKVEQNEADLNTLRYQMTLLGQSVAGRLHPEEDEIAFHVALSHDFGPVENDTNIPFDIVYHNRGGGWNSETFYYHVPKDGMYCFTASIGAYIGQTARAAIVHLSSETRMVSLWASGGADSNQVLLLLTTGGGYISVQLSGDANHVVHSSPDDYYATFSGFFLF